jgi:hypothetical protein
MEGRRRTFDQLYPAAVRERDLNKLGSGVITFCFFFCLTIKQTLKKRWFDERFFR